MFLYKPVPLQSDIWLDMRNLHPRTFVHEPKQHPILSLNIHRKGSQSIYGTIRISALKQGKPVVVKELPGYAVMPEVRSRGIVTEFVCDGLDIDSSGKIPLTIQYLNQEKDSHQEVLAQWDGGL